MKKLSFFMIGFSIIVSLPQIVYASQTIGETSDIVLEQENQIMVPDEKSIQPLTKEYLLSSVKFTPLYQRYEKILGNEDLVTEENLAKIFCYTYKLGPLYATDGSTISPYINRLKAEKLWPLTEGGGGLTNGLWQRTYEMNIIPSLTQQESIKDQKKNTYFEAIEIDFLGLSQMKAIIDGASYPLYHLGNTNYISFSSLEQLGFDIQVTGDTIVIKNPYSLLASDNYQEKAVDKERAKLSSKPIYIGNLQTYGLQISNEAYIPIRSLNEYFQIDVVENKCLLTIRNKYTSQYVRGMDNKLTNISEERITLGITHYFWNGKSIEEAALVIEELLPQETYRLHGTIYESNQKVIPFATVIHDLKQITVVEEERQEELIIQNNPISYGQNDIRLFQIYEENKLYLKEGYLDNLFPKTYIIGTMKKDVKGLKKGEQLQVWGAEDGICYYVLKNGEKITIPWGSIKIPPNPKVQTEQAKKEDIERFVNKQNIESKTKYFVWTDLYRQLTYVFEKQNTKWVLIRTMLCTTGNNITPTPPGEYALRAYVPYFGVEKGYRCKNAVQIFGDYLYHSVMFDKKGNYVLGGQVLGERGSHGCIRLSPEDSEWFYSTMSLGTKVIIR